MNRYVATLIVFNALLGLVGCANPVSTGASAPAPMASSSSPASSSFVLTSTGSSVQAADNPLIPGATGRTIVPGNNSTIAGDQSATWQQRTGTP
jgi:hypothetical protein